MSGDELAARADEATREERLPGLAFSETHRRGAAFDRPPQLFRT